MRVERTTRLRRYLRKDYTQVVEFPVEIVGRDGHVRRYSFDDSVRLYQRRVQSAGLRYDDADLVDAEVRHCRQRIDQLRRSYLEHYGWGPLRDGQLRGVFSGPLAAEVAAFLRRAFGARQGPVSLTLTVLESGIGETCFVQNATGERGYLLYAWRLDPDGPAGARDAYRGAVRRLMSPPPGDGVERLFLAHEGPDIGLVLAGTGEWDGSPIPGPSDDDGGAVPEEGDAGARGFRLLYDGSVAEALRAFEVGMERNPARAALSQSAALVALLDDQPERAEFDARFGGLHHAEDPLLAYLLGIALYRSGRADEVRGLVAEVPAGTDANIDVLAAVLALSEGSFFACWRRIACMRDTGAEEPSFATRTARATRRLMLRRGLSAGFAMLAFLGGVAMMLTAQTVYAVPILLVTPLIAIEACIDLRGRAREGLRGGRYAMLRLLSLDLLPRDRADVEH